MAYLGRAPTDTGEFLQIDELSSSKKYSFVLKEEK